MIPVKTFRFWLEPDKLFPQFKRLVWEQVEVSIRDVLMSGVHPWATNHDGTDVHSSLGDAFLLQLNDASAKVPELDPFGYGYDMTTQHGFYSDRKTRFERSLECIKKEVCFVDGLSYLQLLDISKQRLRESWSHSIAKTLAERTFPGFQDLRRFLKAKDKNIKLSAFDDIDRYDLGQVLSLDDFEGRDSLLIAETIPSLNFRKTSFLGQVTDSLGRLRLVPDIRKVTLTMVPEGANYVHLAWHVERDREVWHFRPDIGNSGAKRLRAGEFAEQWRIGNGRICFSTSLDRLSEMVEGGVVVPSFPTLNYTHGHHDLTASAVVSVDRIPSYFIGGFHDCKCNADTLKDVLRDYSVPMTGNKEILLEKLANLAAKRYADHRADMDKFFSKRRFVRIASTPPKSERLPLLEHEPLLRNLIVTMYAIKHLRGGAILDADHDNDTYTEEQLAHALLTGKVGFTGGFLRVA